MQVLGSKIGIILSHSGWPIAKEQRTITPHTEEELGTGQHLWQIRDLSSSVEVMAINSIWFFPPNSFLERIILPPHVSWWDSNWLLTCLITSRNPGKAGASLGGSILLKVCHKKRLDGIVWVFSLIKAILHLLVNFEWPQLTFVNSNWVGESDSTAYHLVAAVQLIEPQRVLLYHIISLEMPNIEEVQINEGDIPCWGKSDHTWGRWGQQIKISHMVCFQFTVETSFRSTVQWSRLNISKSFSMKDQGYIAFFIKGQLYRCVGTGWWNYDTTRMK